MDFYSKSQLSGHYRHEFYLTASKVTHDWL